MVYRLELYWELFSFSFYPLFVVATFAALNDARIEESYLSHNKIKVSMYKMYKRAHKFRVRFPMHDRLMLFNVNAFEASRLSLQNKRSPGKLNKHKGIKKQIFFLAFILLLLLIYF